MSKLLGVLAVVCLLANSVNADLQMFPDSTVTSGDAEQSHATTSAIDSGIVYLVATLEVSNPNGSLDTSSAYAGLGVSGGNHVFGQQWQQSVWGGDEGGNYRVKDSGGNDIGIQLNNAVQVVIKWDLGAPGQMDGLLSGVYFNPNLGGTETSNAVSGTWNSLNALWGVVNSVNYRVGTTTDNDWTFSDVAVYSNGMSPFAAAVPEPSSFVFFGSLCLAVIGRRRAYTISLVQ
ncbi:MAG: hypothetical protein AAF497_02255 [Planctomycetota bacterium]